MSAVFKEFDLEHMDFSEGALRLGVLYDLLGRYHHHDLRDATVRAFAQRYGVDHGQAGRVGDVALHLLGQVIPAALSADHPDRRFLRWAADLHEIGISVAHSGYHKHSAYILANADMPGFSKMDQGRLARVVLAHRGKLERIAGLDPASPDWLLIGCLRLAAVLHRARNGGGVPPISLATAGPDLILGADPTWLQRHPLTAAALADEERQWAAVGRRLNVRPEVIRAVA